MVKVRKIEKKEKYTDPFTKALVSNEMHLVYHACIVNGQEHYNTSYDHKVSRTTGTRRVILYCVQIY